MASAGRPGTEAACGTGRPGGAHGRRLGVTARPEHRTATGHDGWVDLRYVPRRSTVDGFGAGHPGTERCLRDRPPGCSARPPARGDREAGAPNRHRTRRLGGPGTHAERIHSGRTPVSVQALSAARRRATRVARGHQLRVTARPKHRRHRAQRLSGPGLRAEPLHSGQLRVAFPRGALSCQAATSVAPQAHSGQLRPTVPPLGGHFLRRGIVRHDDPSHQLHQRPALLCGQHAQRLLL